jgi:hypothetical protein
MIKPLLTVVVVGLCACSRPATRPPYTEEDVRAFVQPGTSREAIIKRFGEPINDWKNPKFEDGSTDIDEIIFFMLPFEPRRGPPPEDSVFAGFQVRLKDGKAVEWMATHSR